MQASPSLNLAPTFAEPIKVKVKKEKKAKKAKKEPKEDKDKKKKEEPPEPLVGPQIPTRLSVDCWLQPYSFPANAPAVMKSDSNFKNGWGLIALDEHMAVKSAPKDSDPETLPNVAFFLGGITHKVLMRLPLNEWSHVAVTFDGRVLTAYR